VASISIIIREHNKIGATRWSPLHCNDPDRFWIESQLVVHFVASFFDDQLGQGEAFKMEDLGLRMEDINSLRSLNPEISTRTRQLNILRAIAIRQVI
jgi:hypothetical protein